MKWTVISLLFFIPPLCGSDVKPREFTPAELAEYEAQQKAKAQAALANRLQEQAHQTRADAALAQQLSDQEYAQLQRQLPTAVQEADAKKTVAKKSADEELKEACEILFKLKPKGDSFSGQGLPKNLQNLVFDNLKQMHSVVLPTNHHAWVTHVATQAYADGTWSIISGSHDQVMNLTNGKTGEQRRNFLRTAGSVRAMTTHTDAKGNSFIISASDNTIQIWDSASGGLRRTLSEHYDWITCLATYTDKQDNWYIVSASVDGSVYLWNGATGKLLQKFEDHTDNIRTLAVHQDADGTCFIISGSFDQSVRVWQAATGKLIHTLYGRHQDSAVSSVSTFSDAHKKWYIVSAQGTKIFIWNGISGELLNTYEGHSHPINVVRTYTDLEGNSYIISAGMDNQILMYDVTKGDYLHRFEDEHSHGIIRLAIYADAHGNWYIVSGARDCSLCIFDGARGRLVQKLKGHERDITALAIHPDTHGKWHIISGSFDHTVRRWSFGPGEFEQALIDHIEYQAHRKKYFPTSPQIR